MRFDVGHNTTPKYTANLVDEDDVAVGSASLTTLVITVLNVLTRDVINTRDRQNALNVNNVTVSAGGLLTWSIQALDLVVPSGESFCDLQVIFEWTWSAGAKKNWHEFTLRVEATPRP